VANREQYCLDWSFLFSYLAEKLPNMARKKAIDEDALFKELITEFFPEFVKFVNPDLYEAIDWERDHEFLEQEMINSLKGKFRQKFKRRYPDKVVKVFLKNGDLHFIFIHIEIQHKLETDFQRRMLLYRIFIQLKYDQDDVSAYAIFTGDPPDENNLVYYKETFGTSMMYRFTSLIAATMDEQLLLDKKHNPFVLGMLAAKYVHQSKGNEDLRMGFKNKLIEYLKETGISVEKFIKLLIFVKEYVHLSEPYEQLFTEQQSTLFTPNNQVMIISKGTKEMARNFFEKAYGYNPVKEKQAFARERKKLLRKEQEIQQQAEEERIKAEEERIKAEEEKNQLLRHAVWNLHHKFNMAASAIALAMGISEDEVRLILESE
jgi:hypothetical protein